MASSILHAYVVDQVSKAQNREQIFRHFQVSFRGKSRLIKILLIEGTVGIRCLSSLVWARKASIGAVDEHFERSLVLKRTRSEDRKT